MDKSIFIRNLFFAYDNKNVISGINAEIATERVTGICGPNGCGKTTLLKILSGIIKRYRGDVIIDEKNIKNFRKKEFSKIISFVPGEINTPFDFTVEEILLMGRVPYMDFWSLYGKNDLKYIMDVCERLDMKNILKRNFNTLSNGEKQIVMVAQALVQNTDVVLMDEPTSHLDINHKLKIFDILQKEVTSKKLKVIVVLHDLKLARDYCDEILFMKDGRFEFKLTPSEIDCNYDQIAVLYSVSEDKIRKYMM